MKKKPIYLWVLLVLSAINSALAVVGILTPVPSKDALRASQGNFFHLFLSLSRIQKNNYQDCILIVTLCQLLDEFFLLRFC